MSSIVKIEAPELSAIEPSRADQIRAVFAPMANMVANMEAAVAAVVDEYQATGNPSDDLCKRARRLRLDIAKVRHVTEGARKAQKEEYLRAGKAIDGVSNVLKWAISGKESKLEAIEKHRERLEAERIAALQASRVEELLPYFDGAAEVDLASMADDVYGAYLSAKKKDHADRIEAERKAEEERVAREAAEAAERQRIREENARLKAEAEEAARVAREEAARRTAEEAERKEREAVESAQREAHEAEIRAERERAEAALRAEREAAEAARREEERKRREIEAALKAREDAERAEREAEEARVQAELAKGDEARMADVVAALEAVSKIGPFQSAQAKAMMTRVCKCVEKTITMIKEG